MQKIRAVLDTNLWIGFLISRKYDAIDLLFESDQLTLLFSERLIGEFTEVALRPKFRRYFQSEDIEVSKTILPIIQGVKKSKKINAEFKGRFRQIYFWGLRGRPSPHPIHPSPLCSKIQHKTLTINFFTQFFPIRDDRFSWVYELKERIGIVATC